MDMDIFDEQCYNILNKAILNIMLGYATKVQYGDCVTIYKIPGKAEDAYTIRIDLKVGE